MKWIKKGKVFDPLSNGAPNGLIGFAQSPQTIVFDDFVRIYFSTRKKEANGKFLSHIAFVDMDKSLTKIHNISDHTVIELGGLGCFDEHGIFPINPVKVGNQIYAYTCGWSRRVSVSVETSTGLAVSHDNGFTFQKMGAGPVLTSSLHEAVLVGDSFVQLYDGIFHMWYIFGKSWLPSEGNEPPARIYKIAHATSENGIDWQKDEAKQIISDVLNPEECQALPSVLKIGNRYHMYFCFRQATDFRQNKHRGYRLGYAYSDDLIHWTRDDAQSGITTSDDDWDSDMMCYPHIFEVDGNAYLLYNGNEFGKHGFGLAKLEQ